jgi:hypothetical protein
VSITMTQNIAVLPVFYLMSYTSWHDFVSFDPNYQNHVVFRDVYCTFGKSPSPGGQNTSCENCSFIF